ncbi:MAG: galactokinase [Verrucomicrobiae bacterium]|nr:galactokinase [Verrucomicrobiae bacterium]
MNTRHGIAADRVRFVWSPYRICPLGAHIDHQLGTVTAMAIDRGTWLAFAPTGSPEVRLSSLSFPEEIRFSLAEPLPPRRGDWGDYARGAAFALGRSHPLDRGITGVTSGRLTASGLSSSASVGVAYLLALEHVNELDVAPGVNVRLDQVIENDYLGLRNGILDQSAILLSRRDHLTVIDCRAFDGSETGGVLTGIQHIPRHPGMPAVRILLAMSGVTQAILTTGYNTRVAECEQAARVLLDAAGKPGSSPHLGKVLPAEYEAHRDRLSGPTARRARHFFTETQRVQDGVAAWRDGDVTRFGRLMTESGHSSIENYECGSPPLMDLFNLLTDMPGVHGARFSGAGFRGCCIALIAAEAAGAAGPAILEDYSRKHPELAHQAACFLCDAADGARLL